MNFSSKVLEEAVNQFAGLPGIGKRTATRLVLNLLKRPKEELYFFADALKSLAENIRYCKICHNIADDEICNICSNPSRDRSLLCVVEDLRDVMAIENTAQYKGYYHVLGGIISPINGIGPSDLNITTLTDKVSKGEIKEVILALSATMDGDTTNFYLYKKLKDFPVSITHIARGISLGDELEYTDELTLGRSLLNRIPFDTTITIK
jgi:recombination protein RecR